MTQTDNDAKPANQPKTDVIVHYIRLRLTTQTDDTVHNND